MFQFRGGVGLKKGGREEASRERADSLLGWSRGWAAFSGKRDREDKAGPYCKGFWMRI